MTSKPANFRESRKQGYCESTNLWLELRCNGHTTTKRTMKRKDDNSVEFSDTITKMRSISRRHCGWSGASTTTQEYETGGKTVLKCLFERGVMNWQ
jgi:hypothetical protein